VGNLKLALDGAEPVVSIKWLSGITEHWWGEADEASDPHLFLMTLSCVTLNPFKEPNVVCAIGFIHGHKLDHRRRRRKVSILLVAISTTIATAMTTTTASTTSSTA
jgi:hypothetical protein